MRLVKGLHKQKFCNKGDAENSFTTRIIECPRIASPEKKGIKCDSLNFKEKKSYLMR
jgi:hypothetical protein